MFKKGNPVIFGREEGLPPAHSVERRPIVSIFSEFTQSRYDLPTVISSDNFQHTIGITLTPTGHGADFLCHFFQSSGLLYLYIIVGYTFLQNSVPNYLNVRVCEIILP